MHPDSHLIFLVVLLLALMVLGPPVVGAATGTILGALHARKVQQPTGPAKMKGALIGGLCGSGIGIVILWSLLKYKNGSKLGMKRRESGKQLREQPAMIGRNWSRRRIECEVSDAVTMLIVEADRMAGRCYWNVGDK